MPASRSSKLAAFITRNDPQDHSVSLRENALHPRRFDDLFQAFGRIAIKRMFGGEGIFAGPVMIGLVMRDQLYLRTGEATRPNYLAEKSQPFGFQKGGKTISTAYYSVPDRLLDDPEGFADWVRDAHRSALFSRKPARKKR